jgi:hypothetical protein
MDRGLHLVTATPSKRARRRKLAPHDELTELCDMLLSAADRAIVLNTALTQTIEVIIELKSQIDAMKAQLKAGN